MGINRTVYIAAIASWLAFSGMAFSQPQEFRPITNVIIGPGGFQSFTWQINNATGTAGPTPDANNQVSGWSDIVPITRTVPVSPGNFTWTAMSTPGNQFDFALQTLINPTTVGNDVQGAMANFHGIGETFAQDGDQPFDFPFVLFPGTYTGPTSDSVLNADTVFDYTNFVNAHPGTFGWSLNVYSPAGTGGELDLVYTPAPVPEPGTLVLTGTGLLFIARHIRCRRTRGTLKMPTAPD